MRDRRQRQRNRRRSQDSLASQMSLHPKAPQNEQRRASEASVDSRTVFLEMANQEEEELLGVIRDVKGFLQRPDGIPAYVSKEQLFSELTRITKTNSVSTEKKVEAIDLSGLLLKAISGRKNRRRNSHATNDISASLDILLPPVICLLPASKEPQVQQASLRLLQQCLQDDDNKKTVVTDTLDHLAANGINHKSDKISLETMKLLPGIYAQEIDSLELSSVITALFDQLEIRQRDQFAFSALLRHREVLGPEQFQSYIDKMDTRQKNTFRILSQSYEDKDFHLSKKRPKEGVSFGMIPNNIINKLLDRHNRTVRAEGAILLREELENSADDDRLGPLLPYMGSFIKFLGGLLNDASPKVVLHILECHDILLQNAPHAVKQHVIQAVHNMLKICLDSKVQIKIELFKLMKAVMMACTPQAVVDVLLPELEHKNAKMREDVVNFVIFALLTFPSKEFDLNEVCAAIVPGLLDNKRRVRQASFECMAVIHQCVKGHHDDMIWKNIDEMEKGIYDDVDEICEAVHYRLSRKTLPRITEDGYVEYGLQIPHNYQTRTVHQRPPPPPPPANSFNGGTNGNTTNSTSGKKTDYGPDVDWILRGSGTISRGSAGSVNLSVGINGASGQLYGSNISLRGSSVDSRHSDSSNSGGGRRSKKSLDRSSSNGRDSWNRREPIPKIVRKDTQDSRGLSQSASPPPSSNSHYNKGQRRSSSHDPNPELVVVPDDVENVTDSQKLEDEERKTTYGTIPRSLSEVSLRGRGDGGDNNYQRRSSLSSVREESQSAVDKTQSRDERLKEEEEENEAAKKSSGGDKKHSNGPFSLKRHSLVTLDLVKGQHQTQFDEEDDGLEEEAPGAFKRPKSAYKLARSDLQSSHWQTEIEGLAAIVRLIKYHADIVAVDLNELMRDLNHECKNLRSQVTRAALQTFVVMFSLMGKDTEATKALDATLELLLTKTADTNRFIRFDATEALDAFSEHCSVNKVINGLAKHGVGHKNVVARTVSGRILANITEALGTDAIFQAHEQRESKDVVEQLFRASASLMCDGSLDVRQEAKRTFFCLVGHPRFESVLNNAVDGQVVSKIRKNLDSLKKLKEAEEN